MDHQETAAPAASPPPCRLCRGRGVLDERGIFAAYVLPCRVSVLLIVTGLALAAAHSAYWLLLAAAGCMLPLVNADLRLLLYPFVALAALAGRRVNCPKCEPHAGIFRHRD